MVSTASTIWMLLNGAVWLYAGQCFGRGWARRRRRLERMSPIERRFDAAVKELNWRIRRQAFKHPLWGKDKREEWLRQVVAEFMLSALDYRLGDPCPLRCDRGYVDAHVEGAMFPERVPCPACRYLREVHPDVAV